MKQLKFKATDGWGGRRRGAGRPNISRSVNHMKRPSVDFKTPLHITLRLRQNLPSLRQKEALKGFLAAIDGAKKFGLHVIHFSLLSNHIHLIVEAKNSTALANGMRSLGCRFGKWIRKMANQGQSTGAVFAGRYHMGILKSPSQARNALEYVLLNKMKHASEIEHLDRYSSAPRFSQWKLLLGKRYTGLIEEEVEWLKLKFARNRAAEYPLSEPRSWLIEKGWMRARAAG